MSDDQTTPTYKWVNATMDAAYPPRDGAGALIYKDRMWLIGGWNPADKVTNPISSDCNNEVWSSADGVTWDLVKPNTHLDDSFDPDSDWEARHTAGYVVHQGKMWIVGGDPLLGRYQNDVWNSEDGATWTQVNPGRPVPWGPRVLHYTVAFKDRIWVMGGQTLPQFAPAEECFYNDIWTTTDGVEWQQVIPEEPFWTPRGMIGGTTVMNDRIWLVGGGIYDTPGRPIRSVYNAVWSTADGVAWTCHNEDPAFPARQYHDVAVFDNKLWVFEGCSWKDPAAKDPVHLKNYNDAWFSADGVEWFEVPETPWKPRHASSVFVFQDALWMTAGNAMDHEVWKLVRDA